MQEQQKFDKKIIRRMAKGTGIVLIGNIASKVAGFAFYVLIIRYTTQEEFGLFSMGLAIINIVVVLSALGIGPGLPRFISYQLGKKEYSKAWGGIVSSFKICSFASLLFAFLLFFLADVISQFLNKPGLSNTIKILALAIPLITISNLLISQLRANQNVVGRTFFGNLLRPITAIILILLVILYRLPFNWVLYAYIISFTITLIPLYNYSYPTFFLCQKKNCFIYPNCQAFSSNQRTSFVFIASLGNRNVVPNFSEDRYTCFGVL
jgi:O-antigen/teichoic acid export membrane protein